MTAKTAAIAKAASMGITNIRKDVDSEMVVANAAPGKQLEITDYHILDGIKTKGVVCMPCARAHSWSEMVKLLKRIKHVKVAS